MVTKRSHLLKQTCSFEEESEVSADVKVTNESNKNCQDGGNEIDEEKPMAMIRKATMMTMIMRMM